jgi:putative ABC transport system permease protein
MFSHYFVVAYRNLLRNKLHALINIVGLGLGLACFVGAYVFVDYTRSFDSQFEKSSRIYTLYNGFYATGTDRTYPPYPFVSVLVTEYIDANFPEIEAIARTQAPFEGVVTVDGQESYRRVKKVDPDFFRMFDLPIIAGDRIDPLGQPGSAVITRQAAEVLYGTQDVLGRGLTIENQYDVAIMAVVDEISGPSHLGTNFLENQDGAFDIMVRYDFSRTWDPLEDFSLNQPEFWFNQAALTHVLFPANGSLTPATFTNRLQTLVDSNLSPEVGTVTYDTRPVSEYVMWTIDQMVFGGRTGISITGVLLILGALVLLTAGLNFVNLATAQAAARAREVGMRKVLGAKRHQVARQYFAEALITVGISLLVAITALQLAVPVFNNGLNALISIPGLSDWVFWSSLGAIILAVVLAAGFYPAVLLARARPVQALQVGTLRAGPRFLRTLLVGVQFTVASFLLIAVLVMTGQNQSLRRTGLGLADDPYVIITADLNDAKVEMEILGDDLGTRPAIRGFTGTQFPPWNSFGGGGNPSTRSPEEAGERMLLEDRFVSHDYFSTLDMELLAGRMFSRDIANDLWPPDPEEGENAGDGQSTQAADRELTAIIDRSAAEDMGWPAPEVAIGQLIYKRGYEPNEPARPVRIVGVVEAAPMKVITWGAPQAGIAYYLNPPNTQWPIVRVSRADVTAGLEQIDMAWDRLSPNYPIQRHFLDEDFDRAVSMFENINRLFVMLAVFAFLIASMGLWGMATYLTTRRRREIGVRKSLGAKTRQILKLLVWDFSKPVLIANLAAWPIAYVAVRSYLNLFVDRIPLTPIPFFVGLAVTTLVAWSAVASQVLLAARTQPARVLRHE